MSSKKFSTGAFCFSRARGLQPKDPTELEPLAVQHGMAPSFIPAYPGDRVAITRAITHASRGLTRRGFLLRPIRRTSTEVIYGIVQEHKDESHQRLDHDFEDTVAWSAEPDPAIVTEHRINANPSSKTLRARQAPTKVEGWHRELSQMALKSLSRLHMAPGA